MSLSRKLLGVVTFFSSRPSPGVSLSIDLGEYRATLQRCRDEGKPLVPVRPIPNVTNMASGQSRYSDDQLEQLRENRREAQEIYNSFL